MNTEQERAAFEAWAQERGMTLHKASPCDGSSPYYLDTASIAAWEGYQAGRAALQSQDRDYEDIKELGGQAVRWAPFSAHWSAELVRLFGPDAREGINLLEARLRDLESNDARWRYIRRKLCLIGNGNGTCEMKAINLPEAIPGWPEPGEVAEFCDLAIDHARRIEGEGE